MAETPNSLNDRKAASKGIRNKKLNKHSAKLNVFFVLEHPRELKGDHKLDIL